MQLQLIFIREFVKTRSWFLFSTDFYCENHNSLSFLSSKSYKSVLLCLCVHLVPNDFTSKKRCLFLLFSVCLQKIRDAFLQTHSCSNPESHHSCCDTREPICGGYKYHPLSPDISSLCMNSTVKALAERELSCFSKYAGQHAASFRKPGFPTCSKLWTLLTLRLLN